MSLARKLQVMIVGAIVSAMFLPCPANSQGSSKKNGRVRSKLTASDNREAVLQRAREQTLAILQSDNACSAWFREADGDAAEVFESVHYQIERDSLSYVFRATDTRGEELYKQPWVAQTYESTGRNSTVRLNSHGSFFNLSSQVVVLDPGGVPVQFEGYRVLTIASFRGNTAEAQITTLLHELGHIIGRIPEDDDSWDGRSARNTEEVLRNCKKEIREYAQKTPRGGN
jgi:hypothetical protein